MSSGSYTFALIRDSFGNMSTQIMLEYKPSASSHQQAEPMQTDVQDCDSSSTTSSSSSISGDQESRSSTDIPQQSKTEPQAQFLLADKTSAIEKWNTEQVGDFVRKLGFFEKEKDREGGEKIKHFLHVNQVTIIDV